MKTLARVSVPAKGPVDLFLRKAEGRATEDTGAALTLAAADIRLRCGEIRKLLITGGADASGLAQALQAQMPNLQITVGDILTDPAALEGLQSCDAVVLAEQCGLSTYSAVELRRELAADYEKQLLGCVLIGG